MEVVSRFDELEKRIVTLESHLKVATILGAAIGITISGFGTLLWTGYQSAKANIVELQRNAQDSNAIVARSNDAIRKVANDTERSLKSMAGELNAELTTQAAAATRNAVATINATSFLPRQADNLQLHNNWYSFDTPKHGYARFTRDAFNVVRLSGVISFGRGPAAVLPPGNRPVAETVFVAACDATTACQVRITVDGTVNVTSTARWISLDGLSFRAAAPSTKPPSKPITKPTAKP